ncbi:putative hyccin [Helianthus anomalus]
MDFRGGSPSSSTTSSSQNHQNNNGISALTTTTNTDPMHSWWESISKARSRIHSLSTLLPEHTPNPISSLADSDAPARSLLSSITAYTAVSLSLSSPSSGSGDDPICNWLYDTFLSSDPDLRLVVLSFIPLIAGLYLSRVHSLQTLTPSLAGFEAVLLAVYSSETKSRAGKAVVISIPDLSQPSLYHTPRVRFPVSSSKKKPDSAKINPSSLSKTVRQTVGVLSAPLEPQTAIKSTKRAVIVGVVLDCYYKVVSQMPSWSKLDFCRFVKEWAGQDCDCKSEFDQNEQNPEAVDFSNGVGEDENHEIEIEGNVLDNMKSLEIRDDDENLENCGARGTRILLPWELVQPSLRILGHCLLGPLNANDVKDAASLAVRCLYARASHDLVPQAILATRSLIQLDKRSREAAAMVAASAANTAGSNANTPSKAKKPEILLVSK